MSFHHAGADAVTFLTVVRSASDITPGAGLTANKTQEQEVTQLKRNCVRFSASLNSFRVAVMVK